MNGEAAVAAAAARLAAAGVEAPRREARLLLAHALGREPAAVLFPRDVEIDDATAARLAVAAGRRAAGEPLSRIVGMREFWSLPFRLGAATLDPRPDTETLVEAVLARLPDRGAPLRLLDLGTGSGCILAALLTELPRAWGLGIDRAAAAAGLARENARAIGLGARAAFAVGDWAAALDGRFDVVVSNPPYIATAEIGGLAPEVASHDPRAALDGGADGLDAYRAIVAALQRLLAPDAIAAFEIGWNQADDVAALLADAGCGIAERIGDLEGRARCLVIRARPAQIAAEMAKKLLAPHGPRG
ncbi:MAG: peptide chain release factor N(5)-glutamine methyltransferase [Alphaproteobacteria bacterium]